MIKKDGADQFPLAAIERTMALRGKSLDVTDALVEDILALGYGGARTWTVLATLFDHVDTKMRYHGERAFSDAEVDEIVSKRDLLPTFRIQPATSWPSSRSVTQALPPGSRTRSRPRTWTQRPSLRQ